MKKIFMMIALLAIPFAMQAQSKFHDVEANEAQGKVKSITTTMMGMTQTINFSEDGKITSGSISDAKYDADGFIQSAKIDMMGQSTEIKYLWENGKLKGQVISVMGQELKMTYKYDEKGIVISQNVDMGGQVMDSPYTDYQFDDQGNWTSRKTSMMGQDMVTTRTFEYYE